MSPAKPPEEIPLQSPTRTSESDQMGFDGSESDGETRNRKRRYVPKHRLSKC